MLGVVCFQYLRCAADNNNIIFLFPYQHFLWLLPMFFYGRLVLIEREPYWGKDKWCRRGREGRGGHHTQYYPVILSTLSHSHSYFHTIQLMSSSDKTHRSLRIIFVFVCEVCLHRLISNIKCGSNKDICISLLYSL